MAKILYKKGLEGQNRIECIEGIEIDLFNGQKVLIYPKYAIAELVLNKYMDYWEEDSIKETEALRQRDCKYAMCTLLKIGSPAAKHVFQFCSDRYGFFTLPTLVAALEIAYQHKDIDALAKMVKGADLLENSAYSIWSCSRCDPCYAWAAGFSVGAAIDVRTDYQLLAVPSILL